jgi:hypothetical protein
VTELNNTWREFFNKENVYSYAKASLDLYDYLKVLNSDYSSIVIPSRGAMPFLRHASSLNYLKLSTFESKEERWDFKMKSLSDCLGNYCVLPFSADPFDEFDSKSIRGFWVKVLKDLIDAKKDSIYLKFYRFLVEKIAHEGWYHSLHYNLPNDKFIFIDTVISGQAICEIIDHLNSNNLNNFYLILIVDENGEKIKPEYKRVLDYYESMQQCTLIKVKKLYTEDQGPAVSGIWSTVYPQIMSKINEKYIWAKDIYGAGTFYTKVSSSKKINRFHTDEADYNLPVTILYGTLTLHISMVLQCWVRNEGLRKNKKIGSEVLSDEMVQTLIEENNSSLDQLLSFSFQHDWEHLEELIQQNENPLNRETTKKLSIPRLMEKYSNFDIEVSSSHLVRVNFSDEQIDDFFDIFEKEYMTLNNVFHDSPFEKINVRVK